MFGSNRGIKIGNLIEKQIARSLPIINVLSHDKAELNPIILCDHEFKNGHEHEVSMWVGFLMVII